MRWQSTSQFRMVRSAVFGKAVEGGGTADVAEMRQECKY